MMAVKEQISKAPWEPRASDHGSLLLLGESLDPGISQVSHSYHYDCQLDGGVPCDVGKCTCIEYGGGHYFLSWHLARLKHLTLFGKLSQLSVWIHVHV